MHCPEKHSMGWHGMQSSGGMGHGIRAMHVALPIMVAGWMGAMMFGWMMGMLMAKKKMMMGGWRRGMYAGHHHHGDNAPPCCEWHGETVE